ncbi:MAG TPA: sigma 54-interacting transcriptional regulator [Pyrinomonadaceae bacterium]|nr:sigma 54-interacting transcriptional regulator [Pyrinomonadaceae bacterium]
MDLASYPVQISDNASLNRSEQARLRCALAKELEVAGNYETACTVLSEFWPRVGQRPQTEDLSAGAGAELLLRAGALTGWSGSLKQLADYQHLAKDLITESERIFSSLGEASKVLEAHIELALCYWREAAFDEARVLLQSVAERSASVSDELKIVALLRSAEVERSATRLSDAMQFLKEALPLVEASSNHALKGNFHNTHGNVLTSLGASENRSDYIDQSLIEFAAASFHFEQAGHIRYRARVENNLGFLFARIGRFDEAHQHLDDARRLFVSLREHGSVAQIDETRARALLAQGRNSDAERIVRTAVNTLQKGSDLAFLGESLTTHGTALARLGRTEQAQATLERAIAVGEESGDLEGAGHAALTVIEELAEHLSEHALRALYERADELLKGSQHPERLKRLRACARRLIAAKDAPARRDFAAKPFVYASEKTAEIVRYAHNIAVTDRPALISGETGTGKEVLARLLHEWSGRRGKFVAVNCAALSESILESQLFGHLKGSFTDAIEDHIGAVRIAVGGTLFLDEIGELSSENQGKLLRLIECGEVCTVGSPMPEHVDVRIIAATNHDLKQDVARGVFRSDLFYRLSAFHVEIPPLRERPEDIPAIARHFIEEASTRHGKRLGFTPESLERMRQLPLKGNARELRAMIERTFLLAADGSEISAQAVETVLVRESQKAGFSDAWAGCSLEEEVRLYESNLIRLALDASKGQLTHAARLLGITHQGLAFILNGRQKELLGERKPANKRRVSILRAQPKGGGRPRKSDKKADA